MGFTLRTVRGRVEMSPVTSSGVGRILSAAEQAGLDVHRQRRRTWDMPEGREGVTASLAESLSSNDGWWIRPDEAANLAAELPVVAALSDDPAFVLEAARFFAIAARSGGLYVL